VRIGVLTNLRAGRSSTRVSRILSFLQGHPDVPHVETESHDQIPGALAVLANHGVDVLAVNGGDGTLQRALTEILGNGAFAHPPLIAPLRGGRTNMNALDLGSRRNPVAALSSLIEAARNRSIHTRTVERAVLRVDCGPQGAVQYGMCFGAGVIHRAVEFKHQLLPERHFQGLLGAGVFAGALITRAAFGSVSGLLTPDRMEIRLDGQPVVRENFQVVMATTLKRLFLGIQPFWGQEAAPIRFTAIAAGAPRTPSVVIRVLCGYPPLNGTRDPAYTSRNVRLAELRLDCGLVVDGELFAPEPGRAVRIETDQRARFVRA
jgi:diacylglycerol kinase (ATP)